MREPVAGGAMPSSIAPVLFMGLLMSVVPGVIVTGRLA